jgi:hypothetical protein
MNPSNPDQTQLGIGNDYYNAASAVSPNAHHQDKNLICFPLAMLPNQYLRLHRHWTINILRIQRANNHFLIVLHRFGTNINVFMLCNWKSIAMNLIHPLLWQQFSILRKFMIFFPDFEGKDDDNFLSFRTLQRPQSS